MKSILLVITTLLFLSNASAQTEFDGEVSWGELIKVSPRSGSPVVIGQDGNSVYIIRYVKSKKFIEKYKLSNLQLEKSVELELEYNGKDLTIKDQFMFGGRPVFFTSFYNKKQKKTYAFLQTINKSNLVVSKPILVSERVIPKRNGIIGTIISNNEGRSSFDNAFILSEDGDFGFVASAVYPKGEVVDKFTKRIGFKGRLYDTDLGLLIEANFELPHKNFIMEGYKIGNNGLVYIAGYPYEMVEDDSRLIKKNVKELDNLEILVLDPENGDIEVLKIEMDRDVSNFTFRVESDGGIVIAGLTTKEDESGISGAFYTRYNAKLQEVGENVFDFEEDFITQGWSSRSKKKLEKKQKKDTRKGQEKTKATLYEYEIRDLIVKDDNTTTLLAEQYYVRVVTRTTSDGNGGTTTTTDYYYYYKDIIAINFDKDGELVWKSRIDKYQVSKNDGGYYSSFFTVVNGNDINIIYNQRESDMVDTEGMTRAEKSKLRRNTVGVNVILADDGSQQKEKLFDFEEGGLRLVPKVCSKAGDDMAFIYARARKGDQIGIIEY